MEFFSRSSASNIYTHMYIYELIYMYTYIHIGNHIKYIYSGNTHTYLEKMIAITPQHCSKIFYVFIVWKRQMDNVRYIAYVQF